MKKIFTLILGMAVMAIAANAQTLKRMDVKFTANDFAVDGYIDEDGDADPWTSDDWVDQAEVSSGTSTGDAASVFQLKHDGDNLYVGVMVEDATPSNDEAAIGNTYERDCVEVFIAMDTIDTDAGSYDNTNSNDYQFRFQREYETDGANQLNSIPVEWLVETSSSEWSLEVKFPLTESMNSNGSFDGEYLKFDIQTADNTTGAASGRTQQMFWNVGTDQQWQNTKDFGIIRLMSAEESGVGVNELATAGSAFVKNDILKVKNVNGIVNVYDLRGAIVRSAQVNGSASINIADLNSGMYVVKGANLSAKIVK